MTRPRLPIWGPACAYQYLLGARVSEIAAQNRCSEQTVYSRLHECGFRTRRKGPEPGRFHHRVLPFHEIVRTVTERRAGSTLQQIADRAGVSKEAIRQRIRRWEKRT